MGVPRFKSALPLDRPDTLGLYVLICPTGKKGPVHAGRPGEAWLDLQAAIWVGLGPLCTSVFKSPKM